MARKHLCIPTQQGDLDFKSSHEGGKLEITFWSREETKQFLIGEFDTDTIKALTDDLQDFVRFMNQDAE